MIIPEDLIIHEADENLVEKMNEYEMEETNLFQLNSDFHSISVVQSDIGRFLKYNDTYQAGYIQTKDYCGNLPYINYFLIPYLMNKNIKDVLLVGFGSGILVNQFEQIFNNLNRIDVVDIEENIFEIAQKYFDFKKTPQVKFNLQDALIFLKQNRKKYDLIIVDVANDEGIDERFCNVEYLQLIKSRLKKQGIFVSNMPSSRDIFNKKNKFILNLIDEYKNVFSNLKLFNGETSNKIFYKTFFNLDEIVLDVTNLIFIASDKNYDFTNINVVKNKLKIDIEKYLKDLID